MTVLTLVTGNKAKLAEWRRLLPNGVDLEAVEIDLEEIQTLDMAALLADKARRAYAIVGKPVIVEDIAAGLDRLKGLPGPFIKFFEAELGEDALYQLAETSSEAATVTCVAAYFDGTELISVQVQVHGKAVAARGEHGFGFDKTFLLDGQTRTYGEMTTNEKDAVSHRGLAVRQLLEKISGTLELNSN